MTCDLYAQLLSNFTADTTKGCGALSVKFTQTASGNPSSFLWDFGNGNTSTLPNPTANYSSIGQFSVSLTVSDGSNNNSITKTNFIQVFANPKALFTPTKTGGCSPLSVNFNQQSSSGSSPISSYLWDFGDGSPPSSQSNPSHVYQTPGNYPVSLQIFDQNNCSDSYLYNSIQVSPAPIASFTTQNPRGACQAPYTVNFVNNSTGVGLSYIWNFGDGASSNLQNPSHTYQNSGTYDVQLIVNDGSCTDTIVFTRYIVIQQVIALFGIEEDTICYGSEFAPLDSSIGGIFYAWEMGDGITYNGPNPKHVYQDSGWYRIRLRVASSQTCVDEYIDSVYVDRLFPSFTRDKDFICTRGDSSILTASGGPFDSLVWLIGINGFAANFNANPLKFYHFSNASFKDTLRVFNERGCREQVIIDSLRVADLLDIRLSSSQAAGCEPLKVKFSYFLFGVDTANAWFWDFGNGQTSTQRFPDSVQYDTAGTYEVKLRVSTPSGCEAFGQGQVTVGKKQVPFFTIPFDTLCPQDSIIALDFSADTSLIETFQYRAFTNTDFIDGIDSMPEFIFKNFQDTGYYSVNVKVLDRGCETEFQIDSAFFVDGPIVGAGYIQNCQNRLDLKFFGAIKRCTRFYWDFGDGSPLDSINHNPVHLYANPDTFYVVLKGYNDTSGCPMFIDTLEIDLTTPPPSSIISDTNDICLGAFSRSNFLYQAIYHNPYWIIDGDTLSDSIIFVHQFKTKGIKIIHLNLTDNLGCKSDYYDTIRVYKPEANFGSDFQIGCSPLTVQFFDSSIVDTSIVEWHWTFENGDTSILASPTRVYSKTGSYPVGLRIKNEFGCSDTIEKSDFIRLDTINAAFLFSPTVLCVGEQLLLRNRSIGAGLTYHWDFGGGADSSNQFEPTVIFNSPGTYTLKLRVTDSLACTDEEIKSNAIIVQAKPLADFSSDTSIAKCYPLAVQFFDSSQGSISKWFWDFGDGSSSVLENPYHNYTLPGKYTVRLIVETSSGCSDTIIKPNYIQTEGPQAQFNINKDSVCIGEAILFTLSNRQNVASFVWDFGDGISSTIDSVNHAYQRTGLLFPNLILQDSSGACIISLKDTIFVQPVESRIGLSDTLYCGLPANYQFNNLSIGASSFEWRIDNNVFNQNTVNYSFNAYGRYSIQLLVNSSIGCKDTAETFVRVAPKPVAIASPDTGICLGDSVQIQASGGIQYQWWPDGFLSNPYDSVTWAYPDSTTSYHVKVSNAFLCSDTAITKLIVPELLYPLQLFDTSIIIGEQINLNANIGPYFNFRWTPSSGLSCSDCPNPTAQPGSTITYFLEVFDDFGCIQLFDTLSIEVNNSFTLDIPNAFTPNGDGKNDIIYAKGWGIKELVNFQIYNRFGELVFETSDINRGWNGNYKGEPQPVETYVYVVEALTFANKTIKKKGNIMLIR